jgi:hypothetical protein
MKIILETLIASMGASMDAIIVYAIGMNAEELSTHAQAETIAEKLVRNILASKITTSSKMYYWK